MTIGVSKIQNEDSTFELNINKIIMILIPLIACCIRLGHD